MLWAAVMPAVSLLSSAVRRLFNAAKTLSGAALPSGFWSSKICWAVSEAWNVPPWGFWIWRVEAAVESWSTPFGGAEIELIAGVLVVVAAENKAALHLRLTDVHHLRKQALHLLSQRGARIGALQRTCPLGGDLGDAIHQLDRGAESVVGALRVGLAPDPDCSGSECLALRWREVAAGRRFDRAHPMPLRSSGRR